MKDAIHFTGEYVNGCGQAHAYCEQHTPFFNRPMLGTFNVRLNENFVDDSIIPARSGGVHRYYMARLTKGNVGFYGWIYRWEGSMMGRTHRTKNVVEIVSRRQIGDEFKTGKIDVAIFPRWPDEKIKAWAADQYWFQTFPWTPKRKDGVITADSGLVWETIRPACKWSGKRVLDIGTHYGYHALRAASEGSLVVGFEPEDDSRRTAEIIDRHIEQQGVEYVAADPGGRFDAILYLSVHHQIDPAYDGLAEMIKSLSARCGDLFVELILPESFRQFGGGKSNSAVDALVGGVPLLTYKHNVRGHRRIYHVGGER